MKISYERLNQIIEEEVVRFKQLNEQTQETATSSLAVAQFIKDNVKGITNPDVLRNALLTAVGKIQDVATLKQIQGTLGIQDKR